MRSDGHEPVDHGPYVHDPADDYPPYCLRVAEAVRDDPESLGVVIGGSGNGEQIAANKVTGIRCGLAWSEETARLTRWHNDAQVVAVGARMHSMAEAVGLVRAFLAEPFSGEARHQQRIDQVTTYDVHGVLAPLPPTAGGQPAGA